MGISIANLRIILHIPGNDRKLDMDHNKTLRPNGAIKFYRGVCPIFLLVSESNAENRLQNAGNRPFQDPEFSNLSQGDAPNSPYVILSAPLFKNRICMIILLSFI